MNPNDWNEAQKKSYRDGQYDRKHGEPYAGAVNVIGVKLAEPYHLGWLSVPWKDAAVKSGIENLELV